MRFSVLGPPEFRRPDGSLVRPVRRKERLLVTTMVLQANRHVPVEQIVEQLWGEDPPPSALANLQSYIADLRRLFGEPALLETGRRSYRLTATPEDVDHLCFERLALEGRAALEEQRFAAAADGLTRALGLWRSGIVAEGLDLPSAFDTDVVRLDELRLTAFEDSVDARLELGQHEHLDAEVATLVAQHPFRERLWGQLMLARYRSGRQAEALTAYDEVRRSLDRELGIAPGPALQELHQRILRADPELNPPGGVGHLASVTAPRVPRQLPAEVQMFTGRTREVDLIVSIARSGVAPVVAIDGMAGVGKTTLAVRVAHRVADDRPDGQLFVDLRGFAPGATPAEPAEVLADLLHAFGHGGAQIPESTSARAALWRSTVANRRLVMVLDNAMSSAQVEPLIPAEAGCFVLVTSRRRLSDLMPASSVSLDVLSVTSGIALFVDIVGSARLADVPRVAVAEIVDLCGGLPLALRIAATRMRARPAWTIGDLAARLHDARSRLDELAVGERGVAATFYLSYDHLSPRAQRLFRLLGLIPGPTVSTPAVAALADLGLATADLLMQKLVDDHLVEEYETGRYRLHDLLRAYCGRLVLADDLEQERQAAVLRLLDWYLHASKAAADLLPYNHRPLPLVRPASAVPLPKHADHREAMAWFTAERLNLIALIGMAADENLPHGWQLPHVMYSYFYLGGYSDDFLSSNRRALAVTRVQGNRAAEARTLLALGTAYGRAGRYREAVDPLEQARAIFVELADPLGEGRAVVNLGIVAWHRGLPTEATGHFENSLAIMRSVGDQLGVARGLNNLGETYRRMGRWADARRHIEEALPLFLAVDERQGESNARRILAGAHTAAGSYVEAQTEIDEALRISHQLDDREGTTDGLVTLGDLQTHRGLPAAAIATLGRALDMSRQVSDITNEAKALNGLGEAHAALGQDEESLAHHRAVVALEGLVTDPYEGARANRGIGLALDAAGDHAGAESHLGIALAAYTDLGSPEADSLRTWLEARSG